MLYYLAEYINKNFNPPGFDVFKFLTWRSALSAITAMIISFWIGPKILNVLNKKRVADEIRADGPQTHLAKTGTPAATNKTASPSRNTRRQSKKTDSQGFSKLFVLDTNVLLHDIFPPGV